MADDDVDEIESRRLCALFYRSKHLGVATFDEFTNSVAVEGLPVSEYEFDEILTQVKSIVSPTLFIVHPSMAARKELMDHITLGLCKEENFYTAKTTKSSTWNTSSAIQIICDHLYVRELWGARPDVGRSRVVSPKENFQRIASVIDLENTWLKQALGALLSYLKTSFFSSDDNFISISSIQPLVLQNYLRIDMESLQALNIFKVRTQQALTCQHLNLTLIPFHPNF